MLRLKPSEIRFSQDSISNVFGPGSIYSGQFIGETLDALIEERISVDDIPNISVAKIGDQWVSADNRRLWIFKLLEICGKCEKITVKVIRHTPIHERTTWNDGMKVDIRRGANSGSKYQPGIKVMENILIKLMKEKEESETRSRELEEQLKNEAVRNRSLSQEKQNMKINSEELEKKFFQSTEEVHKWKIAYEKISKEKTFDLLTEKLQYTLTKLSKSEEHNLQNEDKFESLLTELEAREGWITELESQLPVTSQNRRKYIDAYKHRNAQLSQTLKVEDERLKKSNQMIKSRLTGIGHENIQTASRELKSILHSPAHTRESSKLHVFAEVNEVDKLKKENKTMKEENERLKQQLTTIEGENERLKQQITKQEKRLTEVRKLTVSLYGLMQKP